MERPEAPAQSAPPVGGREDGTSRFCPLPTLRARDSRSSRQAIKKATSTPGSDLHRARATIPPMTHHAPMRRSRSSRRAPCSSRPAIQPRPAPAPTTSPSASPSSAPPSAVPAPRRMPSTTPSRSRSWRLRGLKPVDVKRETIDGEALKAFNVESFDEDNPPDYVAASERAVQGLRTDAGRTSRSSSSPRPDRQPGRRLLRPDDKALYVVSRTGTSPAPTRSRSPTNTTMHCRTRASRCSRTRRTCSTRPTAPSPAPPSTKAMPRCSCSCGQARPDPRGVRRGPGGRSRPRVDGGPRADARRSSSKACSSRTPPARLSSCRSRRLGGWDAVNALYDDLPRSTEQILHPDKYRAGEEPVAVKLPTDAGGRDGRRLDRVDAGHVRRVPDRRLAARVGDHRQRCLRRGGRLGWRSPGGARRPG